MSEFCNVIAIFENSMRPGLIMRYLETFFIVLISTACYPLTEHANFKPTSFVEPQHPHTASLPKNTLMRVKAGNDTFVVKISDIFPDDHTLVSRHNPYNEEFELIGVEGHELSAMLDLIKTATAAADAGSIVQRDTHGGASLTTLYDTNVTGSICGVPAQDLTYAASTAAAAIDIARHRPTLIINFDHPQPLPPLTDGVISATALINPGINNIYVGYDTSPLLGSNENDTIRIGNADSKNCFLQGLDDNLVLGQPLYYRADGKLGAENPSALRFTSSIYELDTLSSAVLNLKPVAFTYKPEYDPQQFMRYGIIAEDVERYYPELVTYDAQGTVRNVQYQALLPLLLNELKKSNKRVTALETALTKYKRRLNQIAGSFHSFDAD